MNSIKFITIFHHSNKNRTKGWQSLLLTMFVSLAQLLIDDSLAFSPNQDEFTEQVEATKFADIHLDGARIRKSTLNSSSALLPHVSVCM